MKAVSSASRVGTNPVRELKVPVRLLRRAGSA
jgi:hypothetical protein